MYFAFVVCDARFHVELVIRIVGFDCLLRISRNILVEILVLVSFEIFCQLKNSYNDIRFMACYSRRVFSCV